MTDERKLSAQELEKALFGALYVEREGEFLVPHRFAPWQEKRFSEVEDTIQKAMKARASASMYLDFITDATEMTFGCRFFRASSKFLAYIDIYVDGELREHFGYTDDDARDLACFVPMPAGEKRIQIFLPNLFGVKIRYLGLNGSFRAISKKRKVLLLGDSITQGYTAEFPSLSYTNVLLRNLDAEGVNQAIGGAVFEEEDIAQGIDFAPDLITVAYGTNDWSRAADIEKNAERYFSTLRRLYPSVPIYAISPIARGDAERKKDVLMPFEELLPTIRRAAEKAGVKVIDGKEMLPSFSPSLYAPDALHPNDLGFTFYGENLLKRLKKELSL